MTAKRSTTKLTTSEVQEPGSGNSARVTDSAGQTIGKLPTSAVSSSNVQTAITLFDQCNDVELAVIYGLLLARTGLGPSIPESDGSAKMEERKTAKAVYVNPLAVPTGKGNQTHAMRGEAARAAHKVSPAGNGSLKTLKRSKQRNEAKLKATDPKDVDAINRLTSKIESLVDRINESGSVAIQAATPASPATTTESESKRPKANLETETGAASTAPKAPRNTANGGSVKEPPSDWGRGSTMRKKSG